MVTPRVLPSAGTPGSVPLDNSPARVTAGLPRPRPGLSLRVWISGLDGLWHRIDLSELRAAQWRFGADLPNRIGGAARPADGLLLLTDERGRFSPFNPHDLFDSTPGARVLIHWNGATSFDGYSDGARMSINERGETLITIPLLGRLGRLAKYGEGLLERLSGNATVDSVIDDVLTAAGWTGGRALQSSKLMLRGTRVNTSGAISAGRRRVELMDALQMLAATDGGYLFDREDGTVVYVSGENRRLANARTSYLTSEQVHSFETGAMDTYVVNQIGGELDNYRSQGSQAISFTEILPTTISVLPQQFATRVFTVDPSFTAFGNDPDAFIQTWEPLVSGTHFTWDAGANPGTPTISGGERSCTIRVFNRTSQTRTLTINRIDGDPFRKAFATRLARRNRESIREYGVKPLEYNARLLQQTSDAETLADSWLNLYSGLPRPIMPVKAVLVDWAGDNFNVGDIVNLTIETSKKVHTRTFPFWIDAVEYSYTSERSLETTLRLRGAYAGEFTRTVERTPIANILLEATIANVLRPGVTEPPETVFRDGEERDITIALRPILPSAPRGTANIAIVPRPTMAAPTGPPPRSGDAENIVIVNRPTQLPAPETNITIVLRPDPPTSANIVTVTRPTAASDAPHEPDDVERDIAIVARPATPRRVPANIVIVTRPTMAAPTDPTQYTPDNRERRIGSIVARPTLAAPTGPPAPYTPTGDPANIAIVVTPNTPRRIPANIAIVARPTMDSGVHVPDNRERRIGTIVARPEEPALNVADIAIVARPTTRASILPITLKGVANPVDVKPSPFIITEAFSPFLRQRYGTIAAATLSAGSTFTSIDAGGVVGNARSITYPSRTEQKNAFYHTLVFRRQSNAQSWFDCSFYFETTAGYEFPTNLRVLFESLGGSPNSDQSEATLRFSTAPGDIRRLRVGTAPPTAAVSYSLPPRGPSLRAYLWKYLADSGGKSHWRLRVLIDGWHGTVWDFDDGTVRATIETF